MNIVDNSGNLLATVIKFDNISNGKNFITDNNSEFQLAAFALDETTIIERHYHPSQKRKIKKTTEVLVVLEGELSIQIYDKDLNFIKDILIKEKDTIALIDGGHGITCNKDTKFIEVKQGPYDEQIDKKRFKFDKSI